MNVQRAIEIIRFYTGTLSDISGKSVNNLFTDKEILDQMYFRLIQYANVTKGIQDIYSFALSTNTPFVSSPPLALRSEAYKFILIVLQGRYYPADMQSLQKAYHTFPFRTIEGITNWLLAWGNKDDDRLYVFPNISESANTTTLTAGVTATDTTLPVTSTAGFLANDGRVTINNEKILYGRKDATNLYDCVRGVEQTTAAAHLTSATVTEHNVYLFYRRLHTDIRLENNNANPNFVPKNILDTELELAEEHVEGILKSVAFNLLLKVDVQRAEAYKVDSDALYEQYRLDIRRGRAAIRQGANIRPFYLSESGYPTTTNLQ